MRTSFVLLLLALSCGTGTLGEKPVEGLSGDQALARLLAGNERYVKHKAQHPDESLARRKKNWSADSIRSR